MMVENKVEVSWVRWSSSEWRAFLAEALFVETDLATSNTPMYEATTAVPTDRKTALECTSSKSLETGVKNMASLEQKLFICELREIFVKKYNNIKAHSRAMAMPVFLMVEMAGCLTG